MYNIIIVDFFSASNFFKCTTGSRCAVDEGDCDIDADCQDGLRCGINNCPQGSDPLADCCFNPADGMIFLSLTS